MSTAGPNSVPPAPRAPGAIPWWGWLGMMVIATGAGFLTGLNMGRDPVAAPLASASVAPPAIGSGGTADPAAPAPDSSQPQFRDLTRDLPVRRDPLAGLDERVKSALAEWQVPGCAVAIVYQDKVVYCKGFGVRTAGTKDPVDHQTLFGIASVTKGFTSMLAGMLVDEGRVAWDDPIAKHLPDLVWHAPLSGEQITLRDLLCHRTGLPRCDELWYSTGRSRAQVLEQLASVTPRWDFRSRFGYQNQGFLAAGEALGRASQSDWDALIATRIITPLGMKRTSASSVPLLAAGQPDANTATGHTGGKPTAAKDVDNCGPATSMVSCAADLAQWLRLLLGDGEFDGQRLVSRESLDTLFSPTMVMPPADNLVKMFPAARGHAYGLGWMTLEYREERVVVHPGNANGQRALVALLPDRDLGVAVLANSELTPLVVDVMYDVFDRYLGALPAERGSQRRKLLHQFPDALAAVRQAGKQAAAGQLREAQSAYDLALRLDPLNPTALHGRGSIRLRLGQPDRAIADLSLALHFDSRDPRVLNDRALARIQSRDLRGALADLNMALAVDPQYAESYNHRAMVRQAQGDWPAVLPDADRAIELNPKLAGAWGLRGLARLAAGQQAEANADFAECLKLAPNLKGMLDREIAALRKPE